MMKMTMMSFHEKVSSRKMKAKMRTKMSVCQKKKCQDDSLKQGLGHKGKCLRTEDLHIARKCRERMPVSYRVRHIEAPDLL